jgi:hypothetical protein
MLFPDANPGRRGEKPSTNRLSYGTAIADYKLSRLFIFDTDAALGSSHRVDIGSVVDVSEVHAASSFRVPYPPPLDLLDCNIREYI